MWEIIILIVAIIAAIAMIVGAYLYSSKTTQSTTHQSAQRRPEQQVQYRTYQQPPTQVQPLSQPTQTSATYGQPQTQLTTSQSAYQMTQARQTSFIQQHAKTLHSPQYEAQYHTSPTQPSSMLHKTPNSSFSNKEGEIDVKPETTVDQYIPPPESEAEKKKPVVIPLKEAAEPAAVAPPPSEKKKYTKKIILIGDGGVGKTTLIRRFVYDMFDDKYIQTIGTKVSKKKLEYPENNVELTLMIWDVQGQRNDPLLHKYFVGAEGALLVCDVTRYQTYEHLSEWINEFYETVGKVPIILLANKSDLKAQMQFGSAEMASLAEKYHTKYYLTSAKTGDNVEKAFRELGIEMI